jgi:hypothetical protein
LGLPYYMQVFKCSCKSWYGPLRKQRSPEKTNQTAMGSVAFTMLHLAEPLQMVPRTHSRPTSSACMFASLCSSDGDVSKAIAWLLHRLPVRRIDKAVSTTSASVACGIKP